MRALVVLLALVFVIGYAASRGQASHLRCHTGDVLGWATIRSEPQDVVYSMPSSFTDNALYFDSRYNCARRNVLVRRLGLGVYEVYFPGLNPRAYVVTAVSEEGVAASAHNLHDGVVRVALRGPLSGEDVAQRRDVAFSIVAF